MHLLLQLVLSGLVLGAIYALVAYGYAITFATSGTVDFGQGTALMVGALVGGALLAAGHPYWLALLLACLCGVAHGALVERIAVRPAMQRQSDSSWIVSSLALGLVFKNVAENLWGREDRKVPGPLPEVPLDLLGVRMLPMDLLVVAGAVAMMAALELFYRKTVAGRAAVAAFNDRDAARLMGIDTGRVISRSYMLASLTGAFAGLLVAPLTLSGPTMGTALALKAFTVAMIGGPRGPGILAGGVLLGVIETLAGFYVSSGSRDVAALVLLLGALTLRPVGVFGRAAPRTVG